MATTWLMLKEAVANNLGKTDGSTYSVKREDAINRSRRTFYSFRQWSFLTKNEATLTFTARVASLPTDLNLSFKPVCVYKYVNTTKYELSQVEWVDIASYSSGQYVYAINKVDKQIKTSETDATLSIDYTFLPVDITATDGSADSSIEPAPDTTAIELLATAYFFMSSRQSRSAYSQFLDSYKEEVRRMASTDASRSSLPRLFRSIGTTVKQGYESLY